MESIYVHVGDEGILIIDNQTANQLLLDYESAVELRDTLMYCLGDGNEVREEK